ncbi:hypothetical protein Tco_1159554 [Tanacetum coccineum]
MEGFDKLVHDAWGEAPIFSSNAMFNLMQKLKFTKNKIRTWNRTRQSITNRKRALQKELGKLDMIIDNGKATEENLLHRMEVCNSIQELDKLHNMEVAQKAKDNITVRVRIVSTWTQAAYGKQHIKNLSLSLSLKKWIISNIQPSKPYAFLHVTFEEHHLKNFSERAISVLILDSANRFIQLLVLLPESVCESDLGEWNFPASLSL